MTSEQLFYDKKTGFDRLTDEDKQGIQTYAESYKKFLDEAKTERDAVVEIARMAEEHGFRPQNKAKIDSIFSVMATIDSRHKSRLPC